MLVAPGDLADFKKWAIRKLEQGNQYETTPHKGTSHHYYVLTIICVCYRTDADSDVLADYIIALVNGEGDSLPAIRANLESNLGDFLHHGAAELSNEVMSVIELGLFKAPKVVPSGPRGQAATQAQPSSRNDDGSGRGQTQQGHNLSRQASRKRPFHDLDGSSSKGRTPSVDGVNKFARRGRRYTSGGNARGQRMYSPTMPRAYPDMYSMGGYNPTGAATLSLDYASGNGQQENATSQTPQQIPAYNPRPRCRDFDTRGFCTRGASCPYEHSILPLQQPTNPATPAFMGNGSYAPNLELMQANLLNSFSPDVLANIFGAMTAAAAGQSTAGVQGFGPDAPGSWRGRGRGSRSTDHQSHNTFNNRRGVHNTAFSRGGRSTLSAKGLQPGRTNTKLVVENIPPDFFNEDAVRSYFEKFGTIVEILLEEAPLDAQYAPPSSGGVLPKHVALLQFVDHESARGAWSSPDAVFGNRFVKVFWARGIEGGGEGRRNVNASPKKGEESLDIRMEEDPPMDVAQLIAEAQKAHEEKLRKNAEAKQKQEEIEERLKAKREEVKKLRANIRAKEEKMGIVDAEEEEREKEVVNGAEMLNDEDDELMARLRKLEEEAKALGIDPAAPVFEPMGYRGGRGRGRGGYRGRGRASYRGAFEGYGRGSAAPAAVMRLDNRPKEIAILGIDAGSKGDEVLRRFLLVGPSLAEKLLVC
jgi:RNA-binding protein 26